MSFANIRSNADLASRRSEAARLLQVAIDNEVWMEGKMKKFQDPRKIEEVPPQYKTYSELVADNIQQEQLVIKNLAELKIPYDMASQIAQYLSSQVEGGLVKFNASFPTIKADIMKKYNVKLLDQEFIKNYLNRFFNHLESSYGFSIDRGTGRGENIFSSVAEAKAIIPTTDAVGGGTGVLQTLAGLVQTAIRVIGQGAGSELPLLIVKVSRAMPTQEELNLINQLNQITKKSVLKMLSSAFNNTKCPTSADIVKMNTQLLKGTGQAQLVVGRDEISQVARDTYQATLGAMLNQIEIQFRGCSDQSLAVMTGVREAIQKGEAVVEMARLGELAGGEVSRVMETQQMARELLGDVINQAVGFKEQEEENVRMIVEEQALADDIMDKEVQVFRKLMPKYVREITKAYPEEVDFATTTQGFQGLSNDLYNVDARGGYLYSADLRDMVVKLNQLFNRTGRSMDDFNQIVYNIGIQQRELDDFADMFREEEHLRNYQRGEDDPIGRDMWADRGVGGEPPHRSDYAGGGGSAYDVVMRNEPELPDYVREGLDRDRTLLMPQEIFDIQYPQYRDLPQRAMVEFSRSFGGIVEEGLMGRTIYLPYQMTPDLARRMMGFVEQEREAQEAERAYVAPSQEQIEQDEIRQRQADEQARQSLSKMREQEQMAGYRQLLQSRLAKFSGRGAKGGMDKEILGELFAKVNVRRDAMGLGTAKIKRDATLEEMKNKIIEGIIEIHTSGGDTILNAETGNRPTFGMSSDQRGKVEFGVGMKRIPVRKGVVPKRKIGGGIEVQTKPTYAQFGKYAIHLPQLHNKNTLNIKYKSLGAIPTLKPITISDDFKDFIMETLEKKSVNERALMKLPPHEISYFERAVAGAGLLETFKMKRSNTDDEKKDLDRFNILRGELVAGNNSDKLVKELRSLIVKFLNTGRIHKAEGMNLLQELSVF
jgi:hypothetical protein